MGQMLFFYSSGDSMKFSVVLSINLVMKLVMMMKNLYVYTEI